MAPTTSTALSTSKTQQPAAGQPFLNLTFTLLGAFKGTTQAKLGELIKEHGGTIIKPSSTSTSSSSTPTHVLINPTGPAFKNLSHVPYLALGVLVVDIAWSERCISTGVWENESNWLLGVAGGVEKKEEEGEDELKSEEPEESGSTVPDLAKVDNQKLDVKVKKSKAQAKGKGKKRARSSSPVEEPDEASEDDGTGSAKPSTSSTAATSVASAPAPAPAPVAPKMIKLIKQGAHKIPIDHRVRSQSNLHVYVQPAAGGAGGDQVEVPYDACLNQTNIGGNNNKFYIIQLLESNAPRDDYYLFTAWGRVGEHGQNSLTGALGSVDMAKKEFEKKFREKTKLPWKDRLGTPQSGKYTFIERCYEEEEPEDDDSAAGPASKKVKKEKGKADDAEEEEEEVVSRLDMEVQSLIQFIFNVSTIQQTLNSFEYDSNKLPLGKLAKSTLLQGYAALKALSTLIPLNGVARDPDACLELSNRYYTLIPHSFGRHVPPAITTSQMLKRELEMLDALGDTKITQEIIVAGSKFNRDEEGRMMHPIDGQYHQLGLNTFDPIDKKSVEFGILKGLLMNTKGTTHNMWNLEIISAFKVERAEETARFKAAGYDQPTSGGRRLLWHGSRSSNFGGILSQGLRIAPPEAPVSGYMFGKGVYLASMSTKSAQYCYPSSSNDEGLLMLCEAQLGKTPFYKLETSNYEADKACKQAGFSSTYGVGRTQPSKWEDAGLLDKELKGVKMPSFQVGPKELNKSSSLLYDEFIAYEIERVKIRYLLRCKFINNNSYGY